MEIQMEIERIGENKFRCALTEEEICALGFDIDEIIGDSATTQKFVRAVMGLVEEQEHIAIKDISPMVKAEILQNHTVAITFGVDAELSLRDLLDTMNHIMSRLGPEQMEALQSAKEGAKENASGEKFAAQKGAESMVCALRFLNIEDICRMCRACFSIRLPRSGLYKLGSLYYLVLNFEGFTKEEMRPFAFGTVEYDNGRYSDAARIAHIMEQGSCILKSNAIETLMQL